MTRNLPRRKLAAAVIANTAFPCAKIIFALADDLAVNGVAGNRVGLGRYFAGFDLGDVVEHRFDFSWMDFLSTNINQCALSADNADASVVAFFNKVAGAIPAIGFECTFVGIQIAEYTRRCFEPQCFVDNFPLGVVVFDFKKEAICIRALDTNCACFTGAKLSYK